MATKLTDLHVVVLYDNDKIVFDTPVTVTKNGRFNTTLPKTVVDKLKEYDLEMLRNRVGVEGFFSSTTLKGLSDDVHAFVKNCVSRELIEDKVVIKYIIRTKAAYIIDTDGEIIPNGYWCKNRGDFEHGKVSWREGTETAFGSISGLTPSLSVYAKPFHKRVYSYKSGKVITKYEHYDPKSYAERGDSIDWLASQVKIVPNDTWGHKQDVDNLPEVEATEETAAFFVVLVKLIDKANELFKGFNEPQNILQYLANNSAPQLTI